MDIITQLFQKVDSVAASAIQQIYQSLSQGLLPVFTIALTIYVAYWGYEMIYGRAPLTAGAFIWRVVRIALIYSLAFGWSDFSTIVVGTFTQGADGVASAVCTGVGGTNCGTPETSVSSTLSTLLTNALNAGKTIASSGGWGAAIGLSLLAIVLMIATIIFVAIAILYMLVGKIALFLLLGLAPLFIAMALFNFSSALFTGWLRTCAQYALVPVIVYGILGFLLTLMNQTIANLAERNGHFLGDDLRRALPGLMCRGQRHAADVPDDRGLDRRRSFLGRRRLQRRNLREAHGVWNGLAGPFNRWRVPRRRGASTAGFAVRRRESGGRAKHGAKRRQRRGAK